MKKTPEALERLIRRKKWQRAGRRLLRFSIRLFSLLGVFALLIYIVLQNRTFQNWASKQAAAYLSKTLQTKVEVGSIDIDFFDKLILEKFYLEDLNHDTLIYANRLSVNFNTNLLALLRRDLDVVDLTLEDAEINLRRDSGQAQNNLTLLFNKLFPVRDTSGIQKPFFLDVEAIYLHDVKFQRTDIPWGKYLLIDTEQGSIQLNKLDIQERLVDIRSVHFINPLIQVEERLRDEAAMQIELEAWEAANTQPVQAQQPPDSLQKNFLVLIDRFRLDDGKFALHNLRRTPEKLTPAKTLDYNHLDVFDIQIDIDSFQYTEGVFQGEVQKISLQDVSGFVLDNLSAQDATVSNRGVKLSGVQLVTPYSVLGDTLEFKFRQYSDFLDFGNSVLMDLQFNDSKLAVKDLLVFVPPLENNAFFKLNEEEVVYLDGEIKGRINSLRGNDLKVKLGSSTNLRGSFSSTNLAVKNEEFLNLKLERLNTNIQTLRLLIPNFSPPSNFDKLGKLQFSGRFDGFFVDFVADGDLTTDLGRATMDMRLDLKDGREGANYSGNLSLVEFDVGRWGDNPNLGTISFVSQVTDGKGLTLETVDAKLEANIEHFVFKDYDYKNVSFEGALNKNLFDGDLRIKDDNIDFSFAGSIEIKDSIPYFDFEAKVNHLDMQALNLVEQDFTLAGIVDLKLNGRSISDVQGRALAESVRIVKNDTSVYTVDSLLASSITDSYGDKHLSITSEVLNANIDGQFDLAQITNAVIQYLEKNYEVFADKLSIQSKADTVDVHQFSFDLKIIDSKNLHELIDPRLDTIRNAEAKGLLDNINDSLFVDVKLLELGFDNFAFDDLVLIVNGNKDQSYIDFGAFHTVINDRTHFAPLYFISYINHDTVNFNINATNFTKVLDNINLNGKFYFLEDYMQISFLPSNLVLLNENWDIHENNYIRFRKNYIETKNFELRNGEQVINLASKGEQGLVFNLKNLNIEFVNDLWTYDRLQFKGMLEVKAEINNVFKLEDLVADISIDTFRVNEESWGKLRLHGNTINIKNPVTSWVTITNQQQVLTAKGFYMPPTAASRQPGAKYPPNYFAYSVDINNYPLKIAQYIIGNGVSNTVGRFNADVVLKGVPSQPQINGEIRVYDGAITINYLGTRYYIHDQKAVVSSTMFDATGSFMTDAQGNRATVTGGLIHDHLRNFGINARIRANNFIALNTTKEDNEIYYGYGIGRGDVRFTGSFQQTNIEIEAVTGRGTKLNIPIDYGTSSTNREFITFINNTSFENDEKSNGLAQFRGVNVDMKLEVTDEAEVQLIFDEQQGDIIRGRGNGNIQLIVTRGGDMNMYGDYVIESGDYLFTFPQLLVNKKFDVKQGGIIRWDGDPFDARISLEAEYKDLSASPYIFIQDLNVIPRTDANLANTQSPVELTMNLEGALMRPDINFSFSFPALSGELKGLVENRLAIIREDQNELNRQVFGLIVFGTFLSSENGFGNNGGNLIFNTVSEMLSNQLSLLVSEIFSSYVDGEGWISNIAIDINGTYYNSANADLNSLNSWELQIRPKLALWNNRISIDAGLVSGEYIGESYARADFQFEARLTDDGRWRLFIYNRPDLDFTGIGTKTGAGIRYRKEFDTFRELFTNKKNTSVDRPMLVAPPASPPRDSSQVILEPGS